MTRTFEKYLTPLVTITLCLVFSVSNACAEEKNNPRITAPGARLTKVADGFRYTEGPAWSPDRKLYFTDKSSSRILTWSREDGISDFRINPGGANGLIFTGTGDLIVCESTARRVISIAPDGTETVLADSYEGKKLNSPNDAWVDAKGGIYFSDHSMRSKEILEQKGDHIYYIFPDASDRKSIIRVTDDLEYPNGVIINPGGDRLYVTDSGANKTYIYTVNPDGTLRDKKVFAEEGYDGLAMDVEGNVYITPIAKMVSVYDPGGSRIGEIPTPSRPSNICFGGEDMRTLFLTCGNTVYNIKMSVKGL
ncbi:SMP-30/gluconolactonase/LRE family protein [Candidatus Latescibacterota bacterium]